MVSKVDGNSSIPVGDLQKTEQALNGYRIARHGGTYAGESQDGMFCYYLTGLVGYRDKVFGARLIKV